MKALSLYNKKRRFKNTPEPEGVRTSANGKALRFFIQRHDASHLHYDFRLELDGVLKSWAIPKGPSLNPKDKRLAVMVEDHPLTYGTFEGVIPKGNYGAGTVDVWDKGTYEPEESNGAGIEQTLRDQLKKGSLKFVLHGNKLNGSFALVRIKSDKDNNWLLIKHRDAYAVESEYQAENGTDSGSANAEGVKPKKTGKKQTGVKGVKKDGKETALEIDGHTVPLTNLTKPYWPKENITKGNLIEYYISISKFILPYLKDRPQSLNRNPNGIGDKGFYHKNAGEGAPSWIKTKTIHSSSTDKDVHYIICNDTATLVYLNNLGCIEINPWNSTTKHLSKPDYMILDIDPAKNNSFDEVVETALVIKEVLDKAGAPSYCKTSGASGLHVYVPLGAAYSYDQIGAFAELVAHFAHLQLPKTTTMERSLSKRKGRIYLDYLQNNEGQTLAAAYSVRPVEGATVSAPLHWKEVKHGLSPNAFTLHNMKARIDKEGDLFQGVLGKGIDLKKCLKKLES